MSTLERILKRDRALITGALLLLTALAWVYLWHGAGTGMSATSMTRIALFPHVQAKLMGDMAMPIAAWAVVVGMWWAMMIAMMTPSATPLVLLYSRVLRSSSDPGAAPYASAGLLLAGYLLMWLVFSIAAAGLQYALLATSLISQMLLSSQSARLSSAVLIAAGTYQLSPLKDACLSHCRTPFAFLSRHSRPGRGGALLMGMQHGAWCVGCCWMLMALLFVGGVMNLAWIALLALLVLLEKVAPNGAMVGRAVGVLLVGWGVATLLV